MIARLARWRPGFITGTLCGVLLVFAVRLFINRTPVADWLVAPLLMTDTSGKADAIVVFGAGVVGECLPNHYSLQRVLLSARLWRENRAPFILYTGGSNPASCPVAVAMADLAREVGVPDSSIQVEPAARSTRENSKRSALLLHQLGVKRVLVVTDRLHMRRAVSVFAHEGFDVERAAVPIYAGHDDNVSMLYAGAREMLALFYYRIRGWDTNTQSSGSTGVEERAVTVAVETITHPTGPIVLLGASYAMGWDLADAAAVPIINRGAAGERSFDLLDRFERDVVQSAPRAVIIWGFINDISGSAAQDVDATLARIRESYTRMVQVAKQGGIEPILATELTMRTKDSWSEMMASWLGAVMGKEAYQDRINRNVMAVNAWLVDFAQKERLLVLDLQAVAGEEGGRRRAAFTQDDGSHITPAGYAALTAYAKPILDRHFAPRPGGS